MSRETVAKHLARLKVTYQGWLITSNAITVPGNGFTAIDRQHPHKRITVATLAELETVLIEQTTR